MTHIRVATEGDLDYAVAARLLGDVGLAAVRTGRARGRDYLLRKLAGYNNAAQRDRWLVLIDLDRDECAPTLLRAWIGAPAEGLIVRVAVREIESWLLADPGLANRLRIPANTLPNAPDEINAPKRQLLDIVRAHCKTRSIRNDILPQSGAASVGRNYNDLLIEFVRERWNPRRAAERSPSLGRAIGAVERLVSA